MPDRSHNKMRWYDAADLKAWPIGLAVFVVLAAVVLVIGLGWWSLLTAGALGAAAFNITASRIRVRARRQASK